MDLEKEFGRVAANIEKYKGLIFSEKKGSITLKDLVEEEFRCDGKYAALHRKIDYIRANQKFIGYSEEYRFPQHLLDPLNQENYGYINQQTKEFRSIELLDDSDRVQASIEGSYELDLEERANLDSYEIDEKISVNELIQEYWSNSDEKERHLLALLLHKHDLIDMIGGSIGDEIRDYVSISPDCKLRDYEMSEMLGFSPNDNARKGFNRLLLNLRTKFYTFLEDKKFFSEEEKNEWSGSVLLNLKNS